MHEIDLIPSSYRESQGKIQWLRVFAVLTVFIIALDVTSYGTIKFLTEREQSTLDVLKKNIALSNAQQHKLERIESEINEQQDQLRVLNGFREGAPVERIFRILDRALENRGVWFLHWQFQRSGIRAAQNRRPGNNSHRNELNDTHIDISGQALNYAYLSSFVDKLSVAPEIEVVKILDTKLRQQTTGSIVEFELNITMTINSNSG